MRLWPPDLLPIDPAAGLVVLAASARAIGRSLAQAGHAVRCVDFFADADTPHAMRIADPADPESIRTTVAAAAPPDWPLLYGGAMENRPDVLAAIAADGRAILGTQPADLIRLHKELRVVVAAADAVMPEERPGDGERPGNGWIWKPARTAAGAHIGPARGPGRGIWQRLVPGESIGGAFVAGRGRVAPLGLVRHHRRRRAEASQPFFVMDLTHDPADRVPNELRRLAEVIAAEFAIAGPFGLDAIAAPNGSVTLLECNPRPTAGMELVERAGDASGGDASLVQGKRVVLADRDRVSSLAATDRRDLADIPPSGTRVSRGQPWCSVFAAAATVSDCLAALDTAEHRVQTSGPSSSASSPIPPAS